MNTAIVHYHLNRGGVAQVVMNHLRALDALPAQLGPERVLLCHGGRRRCWPDDLPGQLRRIRLTECVIPQLDYDEGAPADPQPIVLADCLERSLRQRGCTAENAFLHVHNHALGKNLSLPGALCELAGNGFALLLQLHDFAEDFRPGNYRRLQTALSSRQPERLPETLYPQAPHIHYAVLNGRDLAALRDAGVDARRAHLLPNPVPQPDRVTDRSTARARLAERFGVGSGRRYVLYPVRGIRRKNLGETLLWAAAARSGTVFGVTLPPLNPLEGPSYAKWRALASELRLPCMFGVGEQGGLTLSENFAACDRVLTTSLAEGFGLVFLESCLSQRPLLGRDLPEVTGDFVQHGVTFAGLRSRVDLPIDWLGRQELLDMFARTYGSTMNAYGRHALAQRDLEEGLDAKTRNGFVDFGDLDAALQERVLRRVCSDTHGLEALLATNPWLRDAVAARDAEYFAEAEKNAAVVRSEYSLEVSGRRLSQIYHAVMASSRQGPLGALTGGERILDAFLSLPRFRPVRI